MELSPADLQAVQMCMNGPTLPPAATACAASGAEQPRDVAPPPEKTAPCEQRDVAPCEQPPAEPPRTRAPIESPNEPQPAGPPCQPAVEPPRDPAPAEPPCEQPPAVPSAAAPRSPAERATPQSQRQYAAVLVRVRGGEPPMPLPPRDADGGFDVGDGLPWLWHSHDWLRKRVAVRRAKRLMLGTTTRWCAADEPAGISASRWHVSYDDGDEEDLSEYAMCDAIELYARTPEAARLAAKAAREEARAERKAAKLEKDAEREAAKRAREAEKEAKLAQKKLRAAEGDGGKPKAKRAKPRPKPPPPPPQLPKRAKTAYQFFADASRAAVSAENAELGPGEVTKLLAQLWKQAGAEARARFEADADADARRFATECEDTGVDPSRVAEYREAAVEYKRKLGLYEAELATWEANHPNKKRLKTSPGGKGRKGAKVRARAAPVAAPVAPGEGEGEAGASAEAAEAGASGVKAGGGRAAARAPSAKAMAVGALKSAMRASELAAAERAEADARAESAQPPAPTSAVPVPMGEVGGVHAQLLLPDMLLVWRFTQAFSSELSLAPFDLAQLAAALLAPGPALLLAEIHVRLLRSLLRDAASLRKSQLPPSATSGPILQQIPGEEAVTPSTWPAVLRAVAGLLPELRAEITAEMHATLGGGSLEAAAEEEEAAADGAEVAQEGPPAGGHLGEHIGGYASLTAPQRLCLLRHLCDACLDTAAVRDVARSRAEQLDDISREGAKHVPANETARKEAAARAAAVAAVPKLVFLAHAAPLPRPASAGPNIADEPSKIADGPASSPPAGEGGNGGGEGGEGEGGGGAGEEGGGGEGGEGGEASSSASDELKARRAEATAGLLAAIEARESSSLSAAIEMAEANGHVGTLGSGQQWCTEELKAARSVLSHEVRCEARAEERARREAEAAARARETAKAAAAVGMCRETMLGVDGRGARYWSFGPSRLWVEARGDGGTRWAFYDRGAQVAQLCRSLDARSDGDVARLSRALADRMPAMVGEMEPGADEESPPWQLGGSRYIGRRVGRTFNRHVALGRITGWCEAEGDEPALWHVAHDDGDGEDLEEYEVLEAIEVHDKLPPSERGTRLVQPRNDNKLVKKNERVGEKDLGAGAIVAEMLALEESLLPLLKAAGATWKPNSNVRREWRASVSGATERLAVGKANGGGGGVIGRLGALLCQLEEVIHSVQVAEEGEERRHWRTEGHAYLGRPARRFFAARRGGGHVIGNGVIDGWLPADGDDQALWHVLHDDGDEEDLEEEEAVFAIENHALDRLAPTQAEVDYLDAWYAKHAPADADTDGADADKETDNGADSEPDADADDGARLWRSAECRARWTSAVSTASSAPDLALGVLALRVHARLFRLLTPPPRGAAEVRRAEADEALARVFYRADAFQFARRKRRELAAS